MLLRLLCGKCAFVFSVTYTHNLIILQVGHLRNKKHSYKRMGAVCELPCYSNSERTCEHEWMLCPGGMCVVTGRNEPIECWFYEQIGVWRKFVLQSEAYPRLPLQGWSEMPALGVGVLPVDDVVALHFSIYRNVHGHSCRTVCRQPFVAHPCV